MVNWSMKKSYDCKDLEDIVRLLRHPGGCPWDQEQTHRSIRRNFLEETYEVVEAIDRDDVDGLKEELGDVLLQVLFHTSIEEDAGRFDLDDVADGVCKKLIYRHPHVFGDVTVSSTGEILSNWEELKKKEKGQTTQADAVDAVARTLPALWRAEKMKKKAAKVGFDWKDVSGALDKLSEELDELRRAALEGDGDPAEELGDVLLAAVSVGRFLEADPEEALHDACDKFSARFRKTEELTAARGLKMDELSEQELTGLWREAKEPRCALSIESAALPQRQKGALELRPWRHDIRRKTDNEQNRTDRRRGGKDRPFQEGQRRCHSRCGRCHHRVPRERREGAARGLWLL